MPTGRYKLSSIITEKDLGVFEKSNWVHGIPVRFAEAQTVEVLEVTVISA
jgi:hypothetical protein